MVAYTYLEWTNAFIVMLSVSLLALFTMLLWQDREFRHQKYYQAIIAISSFHFGIILWQMWYWSWGHFTKRDPDWISGDQIILLYTFIAIMCVGLLCKIRVFSEMRFGRWVWLWVLVLSLAGATVMIHLPR